MGTIIGIITMSVLMSGCDAAPPPTPQGEPSAPTVENLRRVLQDPELQKRDPDRVMEAIQSVGRRRVLQAIPDLINLLGFRYRYKWEKESQGARVILHPITVSSRYPAVAALWEIGAPALPALLLEVETREFSSVESRNARYTIRSMFRDEPYKADEFFEHASANASSIEAAERLKKALKTAEDDMKPTKEDLSW